jgi:hypothetical protein
MVVAYDGRLDAALDGSVEGLVVAGAVDGVVPTVICACAAGTHDNSTQPTTGHQISCEQRVLIVMGAAGHPGTGPMVGWAKFRTGLLG